MGIDITSEYSITQMNIAYCVGGLIAICFVYVIRSRISKVRAARRNAAFYAELDRKEQEIQKRRLRELERILEVLEPEVFKVVENFPKLLEKIDSRLHSSRYEDPDFWITIIKDKPEVFQVAERIPALLNKIDSSPLFWSKAIICHPVVFQLAEKYPELLDEIDHNYPCIESIEADPLKYLEKHLKLPAVSYEKFSSSVPQEPRRSETH